MYKDNNYCNLSDKDLLNLIVSESKAESLFQQYKTIEEILIHSYPQELKNIAGVGEKTTSKLQAVSELAHRLFHRKAREKTVIKKPDDAYELCRDMQNLKRETCRAIYLDVKNQVIGVETISIGTTNTALLSPKEVLSKGIKMLASAFIILHNHPSSQVKASLEDVRVTRKIKKAADAVGIDLLDHIIIGVGKFYSIKEHHDLEVD